MSVSPEPEGAAWREQLAITRTWLPSRELLSWSIVSMIIGWDQSVQRTFKKLEANIVQSLLAALTLPKACGLWTNSPLHKEMESTMHKFVSQLTTQGVEKAIRVEAARRETFSAVVNILGHFDKLKDKEIKKLQQERLMYRCFMKMDPEKLPKLDDKAKQKLAADVGPDPFEREVEVMAPDSHFITTNCLIHTAYSGPYRTLLSSGITSQLSTVVKTK